MEGEVVEGPFQTPLFHAINKLGGIDVILTSTDLSCVLTKFPEGYVSQSLVLVSSKKNWYTGVLT